MIQLIEMYLLSFRLLYENIVILRDAVCILTCHLFMLQSWSLVLREGQTLRVFNTGVVTKLGTNTHEVTGRLVKLHYSFVASLNQMFLH